MIALFASLWSVQPCGFGWFKIYREQLAQLSVHADIASRLNRLIDEKALVDMGKLEQDLVYGNATSKEVVTFLGYHQQLPTQEKVPYFFIIASPVCHDHFFS
jgi:syntaxin-binding protein 1